MHLPTTFLLFAELVFPSLPKQDGLGAPLKERVVDVLVLTSGERLQGAFWGRSADGTITIFARREWMKTNNAKFLAQWDQSVEARTKKAREQVLERIPAWLKKRENERVLSNFLEDEKDRITRALKTEEKHEKKPFVPIDASPKETRKWIAQQPARRDLLLAAWKNDLRSPETRTAKSISVELGKTPQNAVDIDFPSMFSISPQDDQEWLARMSLVEYAKVGKVHYQGTADFLVDATNEGAGAPKIGDLIGKVFGSAAGALGLGQPGQAGKPLKELLEPTFKTADEKGLTGLRITQVEHDMTARKVKVTTRFIIKGADGLWRFLWQHSETASFDVARPEAEQRIRNDPQLKPALDTAKKLGLDDGSDAVRIAIRAGAATMETLETVNAKFGDFLTSHTRKLDAPRLFVGELVQ